MPLEMGGFATERNPLFLYDPTNAAEKFEAESKALALLKCGFTVKEKSEGKILLETPVKNPNHGVFREISPNGDDRYVWDRTNPDQVKEAYAKFKDYKDRGFRAYATTSDGRKGHKIEDFDPSLEEIILVPGTVPG